VINSCSYEDSEALKFFPISTVIYMLNLEESFKSLQVITNLNKNMCSDIQ
jgi:hypothetical protein